jgi:hypothetical protein
MTTINLTPAHIHSLALHLDGFAEGRRRATANRRAALEPVAAAVRREGDRDAVAGNASRGRARRIAKRLKINADVQAYRAALELPMTEEAMVQWTRRILSRL